MRAPTQTRRAVRGGLVAGLIGLGAAVVAPLPTASAAPDERELHVSFGGARAPLSDGAKVLSGGVVSLAGVLRTRNGGEAVPVGGPRGGRAVALPDFASGATVSSVPVAVIIFGGPGANAWRLNPGTSPFVFGASFRLAERTGASDVDNGDNLVQRGLFNAPAQYKIELDNRRPACRVKGADGDVVVRGDLVVPRGEWFRVWCSRDQAGVSLTVRGQVEDGERVQETWRKNGPTGSMWGLRGTVPLSVGGKVDDRGQPIMSASDQFNGTVDNVVVDIDR